MNHEIGHHPPIQKKSVDFFINQSVSFDVMVRLVLCNVGNKIQVIKTIYPLVRVRLHMGLFPNPILMGSLSIGPHFFIYSSNIIKDIKLQK